MQDIDRKKRKRGRQGREWTKMLVKSIRKLFVGYLTAICEPQY
jgi:hypothetical protein